MLSRSQLVNRVFTAKDAIFLSAALLLHISIVRFPVADTIGELHRAYAVFAPSISSERFTVIVTRHLKRAADHD